MMMADGEKHCDDNGNAADDCDYEEDEGEDYLKLRRR